MQRTLRMAVLLPVFALLPLLAEAQNAKKSKAPAPAEAPKIDEASIRSKVLSGQYIEGRLSAFSLDGEEKFVTVQYIYTTKKANPEKAKIAQQEIQKLSQQYQNALAKKNGALAKQIAAQALALQQTGGYDIEEHPIRFECKGNKDVVIRTMLIPLDEDGKPKKLTPEEQKKLKGDPSLPGNMGSLKDLDLEQTVRVYVDKTKYKPAPPPAKTTTPPKKDDKDAKDAEKEAVVYPAKMIVIVPPPMTGGAVGGNPFIK